MRASAAVSCSLSDLVMAIISTPPVFCAQVKYSAHYGNWSWMIFSPHTSLHWWLTPHAQAKQGIIFLMTAPECFSSLLAPIYRVLFSLGWSCMLVWGYSLCMHVSHLFFSGLNQFTLLYSVNIVLPRAGAGLCLGVNVLGKRLVWGVREDIWLIPSR